MIYNIKLGNADNCYIITGGLTGITSFNPIEVEASDDPVLINIDSESDEVFSAWIKQSMEVKLVKTSDLDYLDIISGNDNDTWGILVENGTLSLSGGELVMSANATLKFKGTLTLETYSEQYKHISEISFTFHDRIGVMEDENKKFTTGSVSNSICNVIASCVYPVVCSDKLLIEWPYSYTELSSTYSPPNYFWLEMSDMEGEKLSDVLQKVLRDFGLQMCVDFSKEHSLVVRECGSIVIKSVTETPEVVRVFYKYSLNSYESSGCIRKSYEYDYEDVDTLGNPRYLMNSVTYPILNNDTTLTLERVASAIVATNKFEQNENVVLGGTIFDDRYFVGIMNYLYYCPMGYKYGNYADVFTFISNIIDNEGLPDPGNGEFRPRFITYPVKGVLNAKSAAGVGSAIVSMPFRLHKSNFNLGNMKMRVNVSAKNWRQIEYTSRVMATLVVKKGSTLYYYSGNGSGTFTDFSQAVGGSYISIPAGQEGTLEFDITIPDTGIDIFGIASLVISATDDKAFDPFGYSVIVKSMVVTQNPSEDGGVPGKVTIKTNLSGNNRKEVTVDQTFKTTQNIPNGKIWPKNIIYSNTMFTPITVKYKDLEQSLLAHLSDQYGWQYDGNRWIVDTTVKAYAANFNLVGTFSLDDMVLTINSGTYSAKYKELQGKFLQVLEIDVNKYRLLDDNYVPLLTDEGEPFSIN